MPNYDAVVVGSGPNGMAAAITAAQAGAKVLIIEGADTIGGGVRSAALTLPGFVHDPCAAIHPLMLASPFFSKLPLTQYGLEWIEPPVEAAHPISPDEAVCAWRSVERTAANLDREDEEAYNRLFGWLTRRADDLLYEFLGPLPLPPRHPFLLTWFGLKALMPATMLARRAFKGERARALFAGMACHGIMPLEKLATGAFGLMLGMTAHRVGWVFPRGGAQKISDALAAHFRSLGGEIVSGQWVKSLDELPPADKIFLDVSPRALIQIVGDKLPSRYRRGLERYRYGPGVCKVDYALSGPIPWRNPDLAQAGTVHLGGTLDEVAAEERAMWRGQKVERPFVLLAQHTLFDSSRAPDGQHTAWAYCHVPNGSPADMTAQIEAQIERFAPGFRDVVLARHVRHAQQMEAYNPNYVGGDINVGVQDLGQLFTRPTLSLSPYATPVEGVYLCSSATPPGGGVHGMCGYHAAKSAGF